ncbi:IclR family transcriptional regulator [Aeromicrobium sp. 50.2.37]|uniref:IclR family transcriptional regulator n=1 Tax=Aeromicrobium sp. 50.2.37 TaxID=2969305 RepID=UPI00215038AD|nr:IclR family transcriptional regulator [Aeromicrobium sp. 50.2.37]MCR4512678.1 IclR family transcriptional regulator [Aeromicrobium sp. 50.2.37]
MAGPEADSRHTVLGKAMAVLLSFTVERTTLSFTDLQQSTNLPKATLHRHLVDLQAAGLLDRVSDRYRLSMLVFELGMRASVERNLIEVSTPFLEDLYERTHETVHLGVRDGHEVVYVSKMGGHKQAAAPSRLGGRMPLHATAIGKALLAHAPDELRAEVLSAPLPRLASRTITSPTVLNDQLEECHRTGTTFEFEESAVGIVCVGAPVLDGDDRVIAAISVTGPVTRFRPAQHGAAVKSAAHGIGATFGRRATRHV